HREQGQPNLAEIETGQILHSQVAVFELDLFSGFPIQQMHLPQRQLGVGQQLQQGLADQSTAAGHREIDRDRRAHPAEPSCLCRTQYSSRMRSMRRRGSAAPHSSWSPTVNAPRYLDPMLSLRSRPTGMLSVPLTAVGVSCCMVASRSLGITRTQSLASAMMPSSSSSGTSCLSLMVSA